MDEKTIFDKKGYVVVELGKHPLTKEQVEFLKSKANDKESFEIVADGDTGDKHSLFVKRLRNDWEKIEDVHKDSKEIHQILESSAMKEFYAKFLPDAKEVRRSQFNFITKDGFIGTHIDKDSDPKWNLTCILHFGNGYDGGFYLLHCLDGSIVRLHPKFGDLVVQQTSLEHEVSSVKNGERLTLTYWLGSNKEPNPLFQK